MATSFYFDTVLKTRPIPVSKRTPNEIKLDADAVPGTQAADLFASFQTLWAAQIPLHLWVYENGLLREATTGERTGLNRTEFNRLRREKIAQIQRRTDEILEAGFEYPLASNKFFSLSESKEQAYLAFHIAATKSLAPYPYSFETRNGLDVLTLNSVSDFDLFFNTSITARFQILSQALALNAQVRAANSLAAIAAVTDSR